MITRLLSRSAATAAAPASQAYGNSLSVQVTDAGVAVVTIDQPNSKVNSLGEEMMNNFPGMFSDLSNNTDVKSILLRSAKKGCFVAGADIDMLNKVTNRDEALKISTDGQAIFKQIESSDKPVIAALNGATLGGGLELALSCHYRIALDVKATKVGLPEVMLGLLPGAGGTQRLPKLIGLDKAMPLILQGKQLNAKRASRQGIVNQVVSPLGPGLVSTEDYKMVLNSDKTAFFNCFKIFTTIPPFRSNRHASCRRLRFWKTTKTKTKSSKNANKNSKRCHRIRTNSKLLFRQSSCRSNYEKHFWRLPSSIENR